MRVGLAIFGGIDASFLEPVSSALIECYPGLDFEIADGSLQLPRVSTRLGPGGRVQYDAQHFIPHLHHALRAAGYDLILGFTIEDLYVPGLNFVFGLASVRERAAVVSLHRLRCSFYRRPSEEGLMLRRTIIEAAHELGHLLGLGHCRDPRCVMFFSNSILDTDSKTHLLCANCRRKVTYEIRQLASRDNQ